MLQKSKGSLADSDCQIHSNKEFDADFSAEFLKKAHFLVKKKGRERLSKISSLHVVERGRDVQCPCSTLNWIRDTKVEPEKERNSCAKLIGHSKVGYDWARVKARNRVRKSPEKWSGFST